MQSSTGSADVVGNLRPLSSQPRPDPTERGDEFMRGQPRPSPMGGESRTRAGSSRVGAEGGEDRSLTRAEQVGLTVTKHIFFSSVVTITNPPIFTVYSGNVPVRQAYRRTRAYARLL